GLDPQIWAASTPRARAEAIAPSSPPRAETCAPMPGPRARLTLRSRAGRHVDRDGLAPVDLGAEGRVLLAHGAPEHAGDGDFLDHEAEVVERGPGLCHLHPHHVRHG